MHAKATLKATLKAKMKQQHGPKAKMNHVHMHGISKMYTCGEKNPKDIQQPKMKMNNLQH